MLQGFSPFSRGVNDNKSMSTSLEKRNKNPFQRRDVDVASGISPTVGGIVDGSVLLLLYITTFVKSNHNIIKSMQTSTVHQHSDE